MPHMKIAAPRGVVEDFFGSLLGPLPTGLFKPNKALVTNSGDRASEVDRDSEFSDSESLDARRKIWSFGKSESKTTFELFWKREGCNLGYR